MRMKIEQTRFDPPAVSVNRLAHTVRGAAFSNIYAHDAAVTDVQRPQAT